MHKSVKKITAASGLLFLMFSLPAIAQTNEGGQISNIGNTWEINLTIGANNFLGDLGGNYGIGKNGLYDYQFQTVRPLFGASASYNFNNYLSVQGGFNYSWVNGADSLINNTGDMERWRYYRNLSFKSTVVEAFVTATIYPIMFFHRDEGGLRKFEPFISAGLGLFHFNPKAKYEGSYVDLQPLKLEGQGFEEYPDRKQYKLTQFYIPANFGIKYYFSNRWALSGGVQMRKTFTDYIDNISTTYIDPALFDKYFSPEQATIAKAMYSNSITPWKVKPNIEKADHTDKDTYITFFLSLSIRLNRNTSFYYPKL